MGQHFSPPYSLALDQGGSASRALVFDARGAVLSSARLEVAHQRPLPGRVEQDPLAVLASLRQVAEEAIAALSDTQRRGLQAAGLVCQRSSLVAWDADSGAPLSPVLSWQDTRGAAWLAAQALDAEWMHARTGLYPNAHFGVSKMRWLLEHHEPVQDAAALGRLRVGPLAAYLAFGLLREQPFRVDPVNASRTLLLDIDRAEWCAELLARFGIARDWLPPVSRSDADYGQLVLSSVTVPLRLLSGDQSAVAFAYGAPRTDRGYVNIGTGAFVYRLADDSPMPPRLLRSVVHWGEQARFVREGTVNGAGSALAWWGAQHGLGDAGVALDAHWPEDSVPKTLFLNGVGGLGAPDWRADFASRFVGEGSVSEQRIAVAESIVFLLQRNLECLCASGAPLSSLLASGGLSRSDRFCQTLSDLTGLPVQRPQECEASARGAAFLLAGQPEDWQLLPMQTFQPCPDAGVQRRYAAWTAAMADALR